jgi:pectin methylesterase-like acyl-CoA thioesterase
MEKSSKFSMYSGTTPRNNNNVPGFGNSMTTNALELEVSERDGPFYSISDAIEVAQPNSTILIHSGLYSERLVITKPGLKLMPKNKSEANDIILLNGDGPSILVDIPNKGKCEIFNFKVTHTAKSESKEAS